MNIIRNSQHIATYTLLSLCNASTCIFNVLQMVAAISCQLASQIKPHLTKPEFRQMVLQLLGNEFVAKYLNDLPNQPIILVKCKFCKIKIY